MTKWYQNPETVKWIKVVLKILMYALGIIAAALGVDAVASMSR